MATRLAVDRDFVLRALKENLERAMQREPVRDSKGNETGEYVWAGSVANRALELIGKELGMFGDRLTIIPATTEEWWANLTPEQRDAEKARLQAEAARETVQ
jgi:hypothetical protein